MARLKYFFERQLSTIEKTMVVGTQDNHIILDVRTAILTRNHVANIARCLIPPADHAFIWELIAHRVPKTVLTFVLPVDIGSPSHRLALSCMFAGKRTIEIVSLPLGRQIQKLFFTGCTDAWDSLTWVRWMKTLIGQLTGIATEMGLTCPGIPGFMKFFATPLTRLGFHIYDCSIYSPTLKEKEVINA